MGQYYKPLNESKRQFLYSHRYDNGLKLMEHSYIGNDFVLAVEGLIAPGGAWHGDVVRWEGDYADEPEGAPLDDRGEPMNLYHQASEFWEEIQPAPSPKHYRYVLNDTRRLFVDTDKQPADGWDYRIHALPLLIANGNGRGGGDFRGGRGLDLIGTWLGDVVTVADEVPAGYAEMDAIFVEGE